MYKEIPKYKCWVEEKLVPDDTGTFCLRALVEGINADNSQGSEYILQYYSWIMDAEATELKCNVGGCGAVSEIDPLEILAARNEPS